MCGHTALQHCWGRGGGGRWPIHPQYPAYRRGSQNHIKATCQETVLDNRGIPRETKKALTLGLSLCLGERILPLLGGSQVLAVACTAQMIPSNISYPCTRGQTLVHPPATQCKPHSAIVLEWSDLYIFFPDISPFLQCWELDTQPHTKITQIFYLYPTHLAFFFFSKTELL